VQGIVRKKPRQRFRGTPPPLTFDIEELPDSTKLTETEAAAVIRRNKSRPWSFGANTRTIP
jgi:hypothetical protein